MGKEQNWLEAEVAVPENYPHKIRGSCHRSQLVDYLTFVHE